MTDLLSQQKLEKIVKDGELEKTVPLEQRPTKLQNLKKQKAEKIKL